MTGKEYLARVRKLPCQLCKLAGCVQSNETQAHHIREGQGMSQKADDFLTVALCYSHHQGAIGIHGLGRRAFEARYKVTELELVARTIQAAT